VNGLFRKDNEDNVLIPGQDMIHKIPNNSHELLKDREHVQ